ncbi:MAG: DNA polymerase III subunit alpha [Fimbriimonadaceae bacterium]|nr:DNA polymerase III subunit alpha [Fimbriimonadaceae bacterium]
MQQDGIDVLARWREAGAWWEGESPREILQYRDARGIRRETITSLESPWNDLPITESQPDGWEHREEIAIRPRKLRDEKVKRACGYEDRYPTIHVPSTPIDYAVLHAISGYSFGRSVLFAEEIPRRCAQAGARSAALCDAFSLSGALEFAYEARRIGIKPLIGASLELDIGGEIVLIARDRSGYEHLSQLITACHLEEPRLHPLATWERLERYSRGLLCLTGGDVGPIDHLLAARRFGEAEQVLLRLVDLYGKSHVFAQIDRAFLPWSRIVEQRLLELCTKHSVLPVVGGLITHGEPEQFPAQDIIVCCETLCTVDEILGRKPRRDPSQPTATERPQRALNSERFIRSSRELTLHFADRLDLLRNTLQIEQRCDDDVLPTRTRLPQLFDDEDSALKEIVWAEGERRHRCMSSGLRKRVAHELERITRLNFAGHFLTIWDACNWARQQGILFSGRGSVVDSAVAYCLGLSRIDAYEHRLHFDRFLPDDGSKRPDIDIDFEAKRRDDVRNYLSNKYGVDHVATVAAFGAFCTRGIIREVGKALALPNEVIGFLAKRLHGGVSPAKLESSLESRPELRGSPIPKERFRWIFRLAEMLSDVPRNARAHSSGVVISARPLAETVPVMWSASGGTDGESWMRIIQWDKRSTKHYFDKFDILCLRGQDVLSGAQERIRLSNEPDRSDFHVTDIPLDDENTYRAMRAGELIGIPQSASPAMRQAHIRLQTQNLHDASLVQAGIRPGVGGAVKINLLIRRRRGLEPYSFDHPELDRILGLTYGIVVFQEQIDQLLQSFCDYGSGEAEDIRDKIHKRRREDYGQVIKDELMERMASRGIQRHVAEHVFDLIAGFKGYGFAQGHALAFAEISLRSIHCQQNYPAEYFASLLSAQPAGYYGPCTIANEARHRGVVILPPDVNRSEELFSVEAVQSSSDPKLVFPSGGIRVGLMQIHGLSSATKRRLLETRKQVVAFSSFFEFVQQVKPNRDELEQLILSGALDSLEPNRRAMLWAIPAALSHAQEDSAIQLPNLPAAEIDPTIPDFTNEEKAIRQRASLGLDVEHHLLAFERERIQSRGGVTTAEAKTLPHRRKAIVVGNPIRLRFPPTSSGKRVVFFDLEDETGLLNVTCFDAVYQRDGHAIVCSPYVTLIGEAQDRDGHLAFLAHRVFPYSPVIQKALTAEIELPISTADFLVG